MEDDEDVDCDVVIDAYLRAGEEGGGTNPRMTAMCAFWSGVMTQCELI